MSAGRFEKDLKTEQKILSDMKNMPSILTDYYYSLIGEGKTYITAANYIYNVNFFVEKMFPRNKESFYTNTTPNIINRYMAQLRTGNGKRMSDSYLTTKWSALNSFFNFLVPEYLSTNPVSMTHRPRQRSTPQVNYLTEDEMQTMFDNVITMADYKYINRDLAILKLGFATGLRKAEILNINISDIDFANKKVTVIGKGDRSYDVYLGDKLIQQIALWLADRDKYFASHANTDALFVSNAYKRISERALNKLVDKYSVGIGKHITPHGMRHTAATMLYNKTNDIYLVSSQLHHKNIATTTRYAEMNENRMRNATSILDSVI